VRAPLVTRMTIGEDVPVPRTVAPVVPRGTLSGSAQPRLTAPVEACGEIVLRPWQDGDADDVVAAFADPAIELWHVRRIASAAEARRWIALWDVAWRAESDASWAVTGTDHDDEAGDDADGGILGYVALRGVDLTAGTAGISYWTKRAVRGRGVAPAALDAVAGWALHDLGLHRLTVMHSTRNAASCRVALKGGFPAEGTLREALLHTDGWHDMHVHGRVWGDEPG